QRSPATADLFGAMTMPRNLYPDTTLYVTCRAVHRSYRLVPTPVVRKVCKFCYAVVSTKYREKYAMEFYEFEFLSTHYHMLLHDRFGKVSDFLQELNSMIAKQLNAARGEGGKFFADEPGIQTVRGDERVFEASIYTLANAVAAGLVHKTSRWKGLNSLKMEYGKPYPVERPSVGLWSTARQHAKRKSSQRSGRARFAGRITTPKVAIMMIDRPRIRPDLEDTQLRAQIRKSLEVREAEIRKERGGKKALGMAKVLKIPWRTVPLKGETLFDRNPTFATETVEERIAMKRERRRFLADYRACLERFNKGERDVVFPAGTVRMRLRHNALTEPIPLDLLLAS
ncbi:MAG: hypothetical protein NXI01_10620, partial [Gammaproteobacteria bacterium]|nr:hypothetical protein [Gammaproteobacteria bacterium]